MKVTIKMQAISAETINQNRESWALTLSKNLAEKNANGKTVFRLPNGVYAHKKYMGIYKRAVKCACCRMDVLYIVSHNECVCLCGTTKPRNKPPLDNVNEWIKLSNADT